MTYAIGSALQEWVFSTLNGDNALAAFAGLQIFDAAPPGAIPGLCVVIGDEVVRDRSDQTGQGAWHDLKVSVLSDDAGFGKAKLASAAVCDALIGASPILSRGRIVSFNFRYARTRRTEAGRIRHIELTFRARVADD